MLEKGERAWEKQREGREVQERVDKEKESNLKLVLAISPYSGVRKG